MHMNSVNVINVCIVLNELKIETLCKYPGNARSCNARSRCAERVYMYKQHTRIFPLSRDVHLGQLAR